MSKKSTTAPSEGQTTRDKLIGLGERSIRKTYYPELQQRLRELERFRTLLDDAGDAIFLVESGSGVIHDLNQSACRQLGLSRKELLHRPFLEFLTPGSGRSGIKECFRSVSCRAVSNLQVQLLPQKRPPFPVEMSLRFRSFGRVEYAIIVARDVTRRVNAEQAMKQAEEKYRSIFENAQVGIYQTSPDGRLLSANPALAEILGYDSPRELTDSVHDMQEQVYVSPDDRIRFLELADSTGAVTGFETQLYRKDGAVIWVSFNAHPVHDQDGAVRYFEGTLQDISASKQAEEEKLLLEEQLRQAQKMDALGKLSGGIAHDFNNLLQAISGFVQLMFMNKDQADPDYKYLIEIDRATNRASDIVRRLLSFSRKMEVRLEAVDMNRVVESTLGILQHVAPKMVCISTSLAPALKPIQADPGQMEQVIMNLVSNAIDAMGERGQLSIETRGVSLSSKYARRYLEIDPGEYIVVTVTDSGSGMDESIRQRIFEPFFTTKEVSKGTGLGLSIVYGIVKGHLGHITCYSEPGKGTTFKIYLPVAGPNLSPAETVVTAVAGDVPGGSETILLVDDEAMILDIAQEMLQSKGYFTLRAQSGEQALELFRDQQQSIDLVILDLGIPGIGGEKCLKELRRLSPQVKVIVASGYSGHKIAKRPGDYGAAGFVHKPFPLGEILHIIRSVLDGSLPQAPDTPPEL